METQLSLIDPMIIVFSVVLIYEHIWGGDPDE